MIQLRGVIRIVGWKGLGPVHRSTGPFEMLPHVQKLYKTGHVTASQQV